METSSLWACQASPAIEPAFFFFLFLISFFFLWAPSPRIDIGWAEQDPITEHPPGQKGGLFILDFVRLALRSLISVSL